MGDPMRAAHCFFMASRHRSDGSNQSDPIKLKRGPATVLDGYVLFVGEIGRFNIWG